MDAQSLLWTDTDVYRHRYEKAATALVAVTEALRARRPLDGGEEEFLSLYQSLVAADPADFTLIWQDPFAYFWARLAYELTGWCLNPQPLPASLARYCESLGVEDPHRALALHLEEFKKFAVALAMITQVPRHFDRPLETTLPFSIPGTRFSALGHGPIAIAAVGNSALEVIHDGRNLRLDATAASSNFEDPRLVARPVLQYEDFELSLKPETFCVPGIEMARALIDIPDDYQQQQIPLLRDALALVKRYQPFALEHLGEMVQVIALKPPATGTYSNTSFSDLPGAFILSAVNDSYWMADALIHETLHNRLFFIIERGELLEDDEDERDELYSPWRDDLRPASGLLHAVYVYIGVAKFWLAVCASGETIGIRRELAEDQAMRAVLDLKIGIAQLRRHARFTEAGIEFFKELQREVAGLASSAHALNLSSAAPATIINGQGQMIPFAQGRDGRPVSILASIEAHAAQFDVHRQVANLVEILKFAAQS